MHSLRGEALRAEPIDCDLRHDYVTHIRYSADAKAMRSCDHSLGSVPFQNPEGQGLDTRCC